MSYQQVVVSAIVVTFNSEAWIGSCLESIQLHAGHPTEIIVVDNGSDDASVQAVQRAAPDARIHALGSNHGFSAGVNLGAAEARGRYLLLLNPDAALLPGAVPALVEYLEGNPLFATAGASLQFPDGTPQDAAFTYPSLLMTWLEFFPRPARLLHSRWNGRLSAVDDRPIAIEHPLGACMLVRRTAWDQVGPFDEAFFLYCEEVDWCMRALRAGWLIAHVPSARVVHKGGASADHAAAASLLHLYRSRRLLHRKHRPPWFRIAARFITCVGLAQELRRVRRGPRPQAGADARIAALEHAMHLARR